MMMMMMTTTVVVAVAHLAVDRQAAIQMTMAMTRRKKTTMRTMMVRSTKRVDWEAKMGIFRSKACPLKTQSSSH